MKEERRKDDTRSANEEIKLASADKTLRRWNILQN